jgi:hypothetical protein
MMKMSDVGQPRRPKSILEEIKTISLTENDTDALDSRANHIIHSAINVFRKIDETYEPDTATKLKRRFLNSILTGDPQKFSRAISKTAKND